MKKILFTVWMLLIADFVFSQALSPETKLAVNTISNLLPRMATNEQYTQPIGIEEFAKVRKEWDAYNENHTAVVNAWNKIPKAEQQHPDVQAIRKPLADRIAFFQKWTIQLKATQKIINDNPQVFANSNNSAPLSETGRQKLKQIGPLLAAIEINKEYAAVLLPNQYVPAAEWFLKIKGNYLKATGLLASLQKIERPHPDAMKEEEKLLEIQAVYLNVEKQLKAIGTAQTNSGIRKMWADDTEKYKESVLTFADVLGVDMPQTTTNSWTLFELSPDNYDKTLKDLEELSVLMSGNYKDLVDNFSYVFPTLGTSPCVYRMVSVHRKALIPEVVKLSATRFLANAMHGAPDIADLEKQEGWMDGSFTPRESKKKLTEIKSRFTPVLKKSGVTETEAGLDQLDTVYNAYWRKAEELAPKWIFPMDAEATGDARARTLFTSEIKAAFPGVQIIKLGFAYDAKWTVYLDSKKSTQTPNYWYYSLDESTRRKIFYSLAIVI
ncbi:MAG: hypothetical protein IPL84_16085 [Chitinophagaceae bacterium]|nr:hypothetical protein [Chitinophagaceae bacterium]